MKNRKADHAQLVAELRRLESKPPKRADRLIARHLKCEEPLCDPLFIRPPSVPAAHAIILIRPLWVDTG